MGVSWGALAGAFLAPFLFSLFWKRVTRIAVWFNFAFSALFMTCHVILNVFFNNETRDVFKKVVPTVLQSPINAGAFCMLMGFIIVPVVSMLTKPPKKEIVDKQFSCYDGTVLAK